jgi:hypothetical protein
MRTPYSTDHRGGLKIQLTQTYSSDAKGAQTKEIQYPAPMANIDADLQRVESALTDWSESTVGPRQ